MVALKSVLLLALGTEALAASSSDVVCQSKYGTSSIASSKIPRATTTVKNNVTVIKKVIRKVNVVVIPRPRTTTETETVQETTTTQADPNIETATETMTDEQTKTQTRFATTTSVSTAYTTTTRYTTETVAAPAGFVPIKEYGGFVPKVKARAAAPAGGAAAAALPAGLRAGVEYVQRIDCVKRIPSTSTNIVTSTVKGSRVTQKPKTKTKSMTSTETVTETEYPPNVTETETETVSPTVTEYEDRTQTVTETETVTVESVIPVESVYAACADSNILSTANGGNKVQDVVRTVTNNGALVTGPKTANQCCAECQKVPSCAMSLFIEQGAGSCWHYKIADASSCANGQLSWGTYYTRSTVTTPWKFSNGPCGKLTNEGNR
ncbi:hypothetical protein ACHAPJ_009422 [Fusarium lateritium]